MFVVLPVILQIELIPFLAGAVVKLCHALGSLYLSVPVLLPSRESNLPSSWEFFTTLDYEWSVFRGHRPYRWTIWVCNHIRFSWSAMPDQ
jgi:hypothetical protein